jgi:hypothetical protein
VVPYLVARACSRLKRSQISGTVAQPASKLLATGGDGYAFYCSARNKRALSSSNHLAVNLV